MSEGSTAVSSEAACNKPPLLKNSALWGMTPTQFLGAFNDNLFKQLMLLLALEVTQRDLQPLAMAVFTIPFLLFSGIAGFLSDRHSKRTVVVLSKAAEIVVMGLGLLGFLFFDQVGYGGLLVVLFLMGTQSAFFGPGKYGILPELLQERDLPVANGFMLMTTFLAIIFGTAAAGLLKTQLAGAEHAAQVQAAELWKASAVCVVIAIIGLATSLVIAKVAPANSRLQFRLDSLAIPADSRALLRTDRPLLAALMAGCTFWMLAGITQQAVNSLGKVQLELSDDRTSLLAGSVGLGIMVGAVVTGLVSQGKASFGTLRLGAWGLMVFLLLLSLPGRQNGHLLGFWGSLVVLILLGVSTGMFAIPLQVFIQARPPGDQKGRMIAVMNWTNFAAVLVGTGLYWVFDRIVETMGWQRCALFAMTACLMLPLLVFYHPRQETKSELNSETS